MRGLWNDLWTGDGTLSSTGGAVSIYEPQPTRDRPVGFGFPHCAGGINPRVIFVFVPGLSELYMWIGYDPGMGPYLSSPGDGYPMYGPWSMSDQRSDEKATFVIFSSKPRA